MRGRTLGTLVMIILGLTGVAAAQLPGPMPSPGMMAPDAPPDDIAQMARVCMPMMGQMMGMSDGMMGLGARGGMMGGMMPMVWGWGFQALIFWGVLFALAVPAVVLLLRPRRGASEALSVLQVRMAKGEVSPEEYEQRRRLL
ncbi:MAG: SHOCT domain-containing protein [bacterium]